MGLTKVPSKTQIAKEALQEIIDSPQKKREDDNMRSSMMSNKEKDPIKRSESLRQSISKLDKKKEKHMDY